MEKSPLLACSAETLMKSSVKSKVRHGAQRASYLRADVYQLIDDLKLGHIAFVSNGHAVVIPMTIWRIEDALYLHVVNKSRLQKHLEAKQEICISFAESKEWVLAKSAFRHSANYRSAVLYCSGKRIIDEDEFDHAFKVIIEQIEPVCWQHIRPPSKQERKGTALMRLAIDEGAFKAREGGPNEIKEDLELPVWHGVVPIKSGCPYHQE